ASVYHSTALTTVSCLVFFLSIISLPPRSTLFPYTMLFRSLTVPQLAEKLTAQGIPCERKSIYTDIEALRQMGYDILLQRGRGGRSEEHTSELQSRFDLVCRLLLEKKKTSRE